MLGLGAYSLVVQPMVLHVLPAPARGSMMRRAFTYLLLTLVVVSSLTVNLAYAQSTSAMMSPHHLAQLWTDLLGSEPSSTRAVLKLSKNPVLTTDFFASKLSPLKITKQELLGAITELGSDDDKRWRVAYQQLSYFDPRLAMGLEELLSLDSVQAYPARHRLVDVLSGLSIDDPRSAIRQRYKVIKLDKINRVTPFGDHFFNFCGGDTENTCRANWWAEPRLERLNVWPMNEGAKKEWTRIIRALSLLESFDSPRAREIIESVATGHPDAQPTKFARAILSVQFKKQ